jgi:hypothetical protein
MNFVMQSKNHVRDEMLVENNYRFNIMKSNFFLMKVFVSLFTVVAFCSRSKDENSKRRCIGGIINNLNFNLS